MPTQPPPQNLTLIEYLVDLRNREKYVPAVDTLSLRIQRPLKARLACLAAQLGSNESEIARLLMQKALGDMGIDGLKPLGVEVLK